MSVSRRQVLGLFTGAGALAPSSRGSGLERDESALPAVDLGLLRKKTDDEVVLSLVGDIFLMRRLLDRDDPEAEQVFDVLRDSDAAFANLENGLSTVGSEDAGGFQRTDWGGGLTGPSLRGDPSLVEDLGWMGFDAVSLANNHTGNYGREALLETCATLDRAAIAHAGAGRNLVEAYAPNYLSVGGFTIAFLSLYAHYYRYGAEDTATDTDPGIAFVRAFDVLLQVPSGLESTYVNRERDDPAYQLGLQPNGAQAVLAPLKEDVDRMRGAITEARARADFTILSVHFHWGRSGNHDVPFQERVLVQAALDAGADLVVGHGPHVLAGLERTAGKGVAYSLGNFASLRDRSSVGNVPIGRSVPGAPPPTRESIVLRATVTRNEITALEVLPFAIGTDGRPRFVGGRRGQAIVQKLSGLSAQFGTMIEQKGWLGIAHA